MTGDQTQQNIELVMDGWLRPIAARDVDTLRRHLHPDVVWQGLAPDTVCGSRDELLDFVSDRPVPDRGVRRVDLLGDDDHVVVGVRGDDLDEIAGVRLDGQIFLVFTIRDGRIARIDDHPTRSAALAAAGIDDPPDWR
jgi:ketosteroid isomerase-like protein